MSAAEIFLTFGLIALAFVSLGRNATANARISSLHQRLDKANGQIQIEAQQRAILSKRIAQSETKIRKLQGEARKPLHQPRAP